MQHRRDKLSVLAKELVAEYGETSVVLVAPLKRLIAKCGPMACTEQHDGYIAILSDNTYNGTSANIIRQEVLGKVNTDPNLRTVREAICIQGSFVIHIAYDKNESLTPDQRRISLAEAFLERVNTCTVEDLAEYLTSETMERTFTVD